MTSESEPLLKELWYLVPGMIIFFPLTLIFPQLGGLISNAAGIFALAVVFILGFIAHQIFRLLTFRLYTRNNCIHQYISNKLKTKLKIKKGEAYSDAVYDYFFFSNEKYNDRLCVVKKRAFYAVTSGTSSLAFLIGTVLLLLEHFLFNNLLSNLIYEVVFVFYLILWIILGWHRKRLDKSANQHEILLASLHGEESENLKKEEISDIDFDEIKGYFIDKRSKIKKLSDFIKYLFYR